MASTRRPLLQKCHSSSQLAIVDSMMSRYACQLQAAFALFVVVFSLCLAATGCRAKRQSGSSVVEIEVFSIQHCDNNRLLIALNVAPSFCLSARLGSKVRCIYTEWNCVCLDALQRSKIFTLVQVGVACRMFLWTCVLVVVMAMADSTTAGTTDGHARRLSNAGV